MPSIMEGTQPDFSQQLLLLFSGHTRFISAVPSESGVSTVTLSATQY